MSINHIGLHLILYILFCILTCEIYSGNNNSVHLPKKAPKSAIQKLRNDLLKNYDKEARPFRDDGNATEVYFSFYPEYILDLDEENHILSLEAWIILQWTDKHLVWKPRDYEELYIIQFAPHEIWKPDITVYSSIPAASYNPINTDTHILSFSNGEQFWVPPTSISSYCELDYSQYPLDFQRCDVIFGSWTHHGGLIDIDLAEGEIDVKDFYNTNQIWEVTRTNVRKATAFYNCCSEESYVKVVATLDLKRKDPSIPKGTLKGPSLLSIFFTLLMFWLPSASCQKISLGCVSVIILSICLVYIGKTTRSSMAILNTANSVKSLLYIVATALIMEVIVINLARTSGPWKPPYILTNFLHTRVGKFMLIVIPKKQCGLMDDIDTNSEEGNSTYFRDPTDDWLILSAALERTLFIVYLIAFVAHFSITGL